MSESQLRELAELIAREQFLNQWPIYLLMLALAFVGGASASYFSSYFKKRGENLATKSDFEGLLTQLKANTIATEEIKSKVSHTDWATRGQRTIRRAKLEDLLLRVYELADWQGVQELSYLYSDETNIEISPLPKVELLSILYFPEIRIEVMEYLLLHKKFMISLSNTKKQLIEARKDVDQITKIRGIFYKEEESRHRERLQATTAIENRCQIIMGQLISI